jgi:L-ascorbate metabolism protein UlaG (beta-lactamase superfamily)
VLEANGRPPIEITATPCRHGPPASAPIVGQVIGFSLRWEGQLHGSLWFSGDTVLFAGVRQVATRIQVSTAVLNLGGVTFPSLSGPLRYTMNADEAIELCRELNPRSIVPLHFEGWKRFREPRDTAIRKFAASPFRDRVHWLARGATIDV